jgi:hypothetical protein
LTAWGDGRTVAILCFRSGLTAWVGDRTASLRCRDSLTVWSHSQTVSLCFKSGLTTSGENPREVRGVGSDAGMGAIPGESSCRRMFKSLVRQGETEKEKSGSSNTTCRETTMLLVMRLRHR